MVSCLGSKHPPARAKRRALACHGLSSLLRACRCFFAMTRRRRVARGGDGPDACRAAGFRWKPFDGRIIFRTRVCERNNIILKDIFQKKILLGRRRECYDAQVSARAVVTDRSECLRPRKFFFLGVLHSQRMKVNIRFIVHRNISGAAWRSGDASRFRKPRRIESRPGFRGGSDRRAAAPSLSPTPAVRIRFASSSKTSRLARD